MQTYTIINEIQKMSISEQMYIAETIIKSMRKSENNNQMLFAAEELYNDYKTNKELTVFTNIDFENFYETAK